MSDMLGRLEKPVSLVVGVGTLLSMLVGLVFYFASLQPRIAAIEEKTATQFVRIEDHNKDQDHRLDQIEEGRSIGLQRLAKVEEAVTGMKDSLTQINAKLDRVLLSRMR